MFQPLVLVTVLFAVGIGLAEALRMPPGPCGVLALAFFIMLVFSINRLNQDYLITLRKKVFRLGPGQVFLISVCCLSLALGSFWLGISEMETSRLEAFADHYIDVTGTVISEGQVYPDREVYVLETSFLGPREGDQRVEEKVLFTLVQGPERKRADSIESVDQDGPALLKKPTLKYGDVVSITGKIQLPREARNPGEFDYRKYLRRQGIGVQLVGSRAELEIKDEGAGFFLRRWALTVRARAEDSMRQTLPPDQGSFLAAVLFGDQSGLPAEDKLMYQRLGLSHAFSVSGLHLSYVLAISLLLAGVLRLSGFSFFVFNLLAMLFYATMVGFPSATIRSFIMAALTLGAALMGRESNPLQGLSLAGLILLLFNPRLLFTTGFQLSFAATWGIVYVYPWMRSRIGGGTAWGLWLLLPLAVQVAIIPLVAYYFNLVSLVSIITNLMLLWLLGAIVILGMVSIPLAWILPGVGEYLLFAAGALAALLEYLTRLFDKIPGGSWHVGTPPVWLLLLFYVVLIIWIEGLWERYKPSWLNPYRAVAGAVVIVLLVFAVNALQPKPLEVVFLDVGQGDSIFITTPQGKRVLIDGGGRTEAESDFDVGSRIVLPYLRRQGVDRLDLVVNTHPHSDHLNGLLPVIEELPCGEVIVAAANLGSPKSKPLRELCSERRIPVVGVKRGDSIDLEQGLSLEVLHPSGTPPAADTDMAENDASLVLRLTYRETSFLLTGDVERDGMREIASSGAAFGSQVFKVPHHGSAYGLEPGFLDQVGAEVGVISVGGNRFGHPSPEVLKYWRERGIPVHRTDEEGAITITSDGEKLEVRGQL